jgi:hypothetical protein
MELECECLYCGHRFFKRIYYVVDDPRELGIRCEKVGCNDKNVRVLPQQKRDVFGYSYVPPEKKRGKSDFY